MAKNIEEIFQEKLKNIEINPPANTWNLIEKRIKKVKLFKSLTIFVSLVAVATVLYFVFNSNDKKTQSIEAQNIELMQQSNRQPVTITTNNNTIIMTIQTESHTPNKNSVNIQNSDNTTVVKDSNTEQNINPRNHIDAKISLSSHKGCCPLVVKLSSDVIKENWTWKINGKEYPAENNLTITLDKPGTYPVILQNSNDNKTVTDTIIVNSKPDADFIVPDNIEVKKDVLFQNTSQNANNFAWYIDGTKISAQKNLLYTFTNSGNHNIMLVAYGNKCADTSLKVVEIQKPDNHILFPTAFTPSMAGSTGGYYDTKNYNADNSVFHPYVYDKQVKTYQLSIYDKSGKLIFMSNELNRGWDGYYQNKLMPIGVYVYIAKFEFESGEKITEQGNITLIY